MIGIINYHRGNIRSVFKALRHLGFESDIVHSPEELRRADRIILPGVGAFGDGMNQLHKLGYASVILDRVREGIPFLGICLGMQLLFESSEESPGIRGLGLLKGQVERFQGDYKIPHMGWNQLSVNQSGSPLFRDIADDSFFYFVHSYCVRPEYPEVILGKTDYHGSFVSAIRKDNITAFQFHPEKSQEKGLQLLNNWMEYAG